MSLVHTPGSRSSRATAPVLPHPSVTWSQIDERLWVASAAGEHAGRIERVGTGYFAIGAPNVSMGLHRSLRGAMSAIEAHIS